MSLKYGFAELQALASDIKSNEGKLRETHEELQSYVQGLVAQWESGAQENYQASQARWNSAHNDLLQVLQTISKVVQDGAIDMQSAEDRNAAAWL
ncbi:WXG100 family type VII secretion target [Rhodococcus marinonascens]|uniref:WXG100 family type VII secretion target n=1 Tax=Rhodococcus marinonascens TaxID=38311 RepID=UPI000932D72C|nr:WXG100 family type VII secretion target [Rhodococcus marinonascens]